MGEDDGVDFNGDHLTGYTLRQDTPAFKPLRGLSVTNQFGEIKIDLVRPDLLLVPATKSLIGPPQTSNPGIDHFECYRIAGARFHAAGVSVQDQFGTIVEDIKRPRRFCNAVDKNGGGIIDATKHLLCYKVRSPAGPPTKSTVFILNQFGNDSFTLFGTREFCVPTEVTP